MNYFPRFPYPYRYFPNFAPPNHNNMPSFNGSMVKQNLKHTIPNSNYPPTSSVKRLPNNINSNKSGVHEEEKREDKSYDDDVIFEIFGISLHFDDILLIALIFFLYQEGIEDKYLFIALILLLLS